MRNFIGDSISGLLNDLKENIKAFVREEVELVKKEMSEKISCYVRNGMALAIGGFVAYAGLIVFLAGIGLVIGYAFESYGLNSVLATFIGLGIVGILAMAAGGMAMLKGINAIAKTSPVPEKAIDSVRQITDTNAISEPEQMEDPRSSSEMHKSVRETGERVEEGKRELLFQLTPQQLKARAVRHMKEHPLMWSAAALGTAAVAGAGVLAGRKFLMRGSMSAFRLLAHRLRK